ncbi:hypothetical protein BDC45DRAFT_562848 [Circinella umbellata]|nr:hypothetical protein BDC45DRAFT_562848 [Circinella umbellata]
MNSKQASPPLPKRRRRVVVSLPPKKSMVEREWSNDGCNKCCNSNNNNNEEQTALFLQLTQHHQLNSADYCHPSTYLLAKRPPLKMEPSAESYQVPQPTSTSNATVDIHPSEKHESDSSISPAPNNNRTSIFGNLYDDPAIVHVIEHTKEATYNNSSDHSIRSNSPSNNIRPGVIGIGPSVHETHCPLQCGNSSSPKMCQDRLWQMIVKNVDKQIDARIRSTFYSSYNNNYPNERKLEELEIATAQFDRRLLALEQQHSQQRTSTTNTMNTTTTSGGTALRRRQSMPSAPNRSNNNIQQLLVTDNNNNEQAEAARRLIDLSSQNARLEAEKLTLQNTTHNLKLALQKQKQDTKQVQRECQGLHQQLAEEQKKSKQLEQQHVEFHKRQTSDMLKMDQMQRRIRQLETELSNAKLPTPSSSPPSSTTTQSSSSGSSSSSSSSSSEEEEEEEESVKEEDGYLVFNTNINGELIHCRVKIPSSAATSMRSSPIIRRHTGFPLALVSPPITRTGSPKVALIPPFRQKKKGLNPNAPEWKNGF